MTFVLLRLLDSCYRERCFFFERAGAACAARQQGSIDWCSIFAVPVFGRKSSCTLYQPAVKVGIYSHWTARDGKWLLTTKQRNTIEKKITERQSGRRCTNAASLVLQFACRFRCQLQTWRALNIVRVHWWPKRFWRVARIERRPLVERSFVGNFAYLSFSTISNAVLYIGQLTSSTFSSYLGPSLCNFGCTVIWFLKVRSQWHKHVACTFKLVQTSSKRRKGERERAREGWGRVKSLNSLFRSYFWLLSDECSNALCFHMAWMHKVLHEILRPVVKLVRNETKL